MSGKGERPDYKKMARDRTGPFVLEVPAGRSYFLCQCKKSKKLPNCDASHRTCGGTLGPLPHRPKETKKVLFCGCRHSKRFPYCDNTHKVLWAKEREAAESK